MPKTVWLDTTRHQAFIRGVRKGFAAPFLLFSDLEIPPSQGEIKIQALPVRRRGSIVGDWEQVGRDIRSAIEIEQGRAQGARFGSAQAGCASRRRRARTTGGGQIPSSYGCPVAGVWPVTAPLLAVEFDQATCRIRVLPQALAYLRTVAIEGECLPVANDRSSRATAGARVPIR